MNPVRVSHARIAAAYERYHDGSGRSGPELKIFSHVPRAQSLSCCLAVVHKVVHFFWVWLG